MSNFFEDIVNVINDHHTSNLYREETSSRRRTDRSHSHSHSLKRKVPQSDSDSNNNRIDARIEIIDHQQLLIINNCRAHPFPVPRAPNNQHLKVLLREYLMHIPLLEDPDIQSASRFFKSFYKELMQIDACHDRLQQHP